MQVILLIFEVTALCGELEHGQVFSSLKLRSEVDADFSGITQLS